MKKLIFSIATLAIVFASCSDDDDNGTVTETNDAVAATLSGGPYTFCVGDGLVDNVSNVVIDDAGSGETGQIVITDDAGWILGLPPVFEGPDFDTAGVGVCYIRHVNYNGTIEGLTGPGDDGAPTANVDDLIGDFELSNFIMVTREDCAPSVVAATLEAGASAVDGAYTFCVDGIVDNVTDLVVADAGTGETGQLVVTNQEGWILGLPGMASGPNFDEAGVGICYIRHINYDGTIEGLTGPDMTTGEPTANVNDLEGEFKISNMIIVNREDCTSSVVAATLEAGALAMNGEYTFTVGDDIADYVTDLIVADAGTGETGQFVITTDDGWILGLPGDVSTDVNFDVAGTGVCYIRHINYDGDIPSTLTGPDADMVPTSNISTLEGDFKISNFIVVNRN